MAANTVDATWDTLQTRRHHLQCIAGGLVGGARVRVTDRNNLGTVLFLDPIEPVATVHFISPDGAETTRLVPYHQLDPLETQANVPQRVQHWAATHLTAIDQRIDQWASVVQGLSTQPGDHDRYRQAAQLHIQRHAHTLTASQPGWLLTALGERPTNPIALQSWAEAVTVAARYRADAGIADPWAALGPRPADPDRRCAWTNVWARLEQTRQWLATNHDLPIAPLPTVPNRQDLLQRRVELDQLFATAPADQRTTINQLLNGQQSFEHVQTELRSVEAQQHSRQRWILEHWPHLVEADEIDQAFAADRTSIGVQAQQIQVTG